MRIRTKRIRVIEMSKEEMQEFYMLMEKAREGHTSHYAEKQMADGSYLGVQIEEGYPIAPPPQREYL